MWPPAGVTHSPIGPVGCPSDGSADPARSHRSSHRLSHRRRRLQGGVDLLGDGHRCHRLAQNALHRLQVPAEGQRGRWSVGEVLGHGGLENLAERVRYPHRPEIGHRVLADPQVQRHHRLVRPGPERRCAGDDAVDRGGQRVDVRGRGRRPALEHLGCRIGDGRADQALGRLVAAGDPRDAEVGEQRLTEGRDEHVGRLDVAMQHTGPVGGLQGPAQPDGIRDSLLPWHREPLGQRTTLDERHDQVRPAVWRGARRQHLDDVRVPGNGPHGVGLAVEPLQPGLVEHGRQHLDGDDAVQPGLPGPVHHAGTTTADLDGLDEPVDLQLGRWHADDCAECGPAR